VTLAEAIAKALGLGAAALALLACAGCAERDGPAEATYASRRDAQKANAIAEGRLPPWMPGSARELREARDPGTTRSMLAFHYDRPDRLSIPGSCAETADVPAAPFRLSWWPRDLASDSAATRRYVLYACESGRAFLAIRVGSGEAYYWRP